MDGAGRAVPPYSREPRAAYPHGALSRSRSARLLIALRAAWAAHVTRSPAEEKRQHHVSEELNITSRGGHDH